MFVIVNLTQIAKIKLIANLFDPNAFMIIISANEVMGRGFSTPGVDIEEMLKSRRAQESRQQGR